MRRVVFGFGVSLIVVIAALVFTSNPVSAHLCDFLTGGGFIIRDSGAKANFGVGGGCKHGSPTWGHLEYIDHGTGLNVHWIDITGYFFVEGAEPASKNEQPTGMRRICGTARTNQLGDVNFMVQAKDTGEPGVDDEFVIRLTTGRGGPVVYTTESDSDRTLGGAGSGGGNIQLHKPNPSTTGDFGGRCDACPECETVGG